MTEPAEEELPAQAAARPLIRSACIEALHPPSRRRHVQVAAEQVPARRSRS